MRENLNWQSEEFAATEDLLRWTAEEPSLPGTLRERVLEASVKTYRRAWIRDRVQIAVGGCLLYVGAIVFAGLYLAEWHHHMIAKSAQPVQINGQLVVPAETRLPVLRNRIQKAEKSSDDWLLVEASLLARLRGHLAIHKAFLE